MKSAKLASLLCKTCCSKPLWAFVEVLEGSEMSKFGIQTLGHFSSTFWSICQSNSAKLNWQTCQNVQARSMSRPAHTDIVDPTPRARHGRRGPTSATQQASQFLLATNQINRINGRIRSKITHEKLRLSKGQGMRVLYRLSIHDSSIIPSKSYESRNKQTKDR
jgi:hypothetical protein